MKIVEPNTPDDPTMNVLYRIVKEAANLTNNKYLVYEESPFWQGEQVLDIEFKLAIRPQKEDDTEIQLVVDKECFKVEVILANHSREFLIPKSINTSTLEAIEQMLFLFRQFQVLIKEFGL